MKQSQVNDQGVGQMTRRQFLAWSGLAAVGGLAAAGAYVYRHDQSADPVVDQVQIPVKGLKAALEGFTIAVMADFHLYPFTKLPLIEKAVAMTNALQPDVTVLLGDYVWHEVEAIYDLAPALGRLNARHGVFAAAGNHDYWTDINIISSAMKEAQLPLHINQGVPIDAGEAILYLGFVDDGWSGNPDLQATLSGMPAEATAVIISHEPDLVDKYALDERVRLQLSGHSHGGQIRFPGVGALVLPYLAWKYDMGLYQVKDAWLYTNRGIGVTSEPLRFNCPPEITEITLVGA